MEAKVRRRFTKKKLRGLISLLLAFALVANPIACNEVKAAEEVTSVVLEGTCGDDVTYCVELKEDDTYKLTLSPTGENAATYDYTAAKQPWKTYTTEITEFVVEDGIIYLGDKLLYGATNLASISIPESVSGTGDGLFRSCMALKEAVLPGAITSMDQNLFYDCQKLETVTLGEGTTEIGRNFVNGKASSLHTVTFPGTVISIGETAFKGTSLSTINYSGTKAQYKLLLESTDETDSEPLKDADITVNCADGVWHYGEAIESESDSGVSGDLSWVYDSTTGTLTLSGTGDMANYSSASETPWSEMLTEITTLVIPEGVTGIGSYAFNGATSLTELDLPQSIVSIGVDAFANTGITTVTYAGTMDEYDVLVHSIGDTETFQDDTLSVVCSDGTYTFVVQTKTGSCGTNVTYTLSNNGDDTYTLTLTPLKSGAATSNYSNPNLTPWYNYMTKITKFVVEDGIEKLGNRLMYGASSLTEVSIPESVTSTGNGLFRACTALEEVEIPGAITTMTDNLFYACTNLKRVTIGEGTTVLGRNMVNGGCTSLEELNFPGTVTQINETALKGLTNLTTINFSGTIEQYKALLELEYGAPLKTESITVYCSDGEYSYGINGSAGDDVTWKYTSSTGMLTIDGAGTMADYDDASSVPWSTYASKIKTVLIKENITYIGKNAFSECTSIKNVYYLMLDDEWSALAVSSGAGNEPLFEASNVISGLYGTIGDSISWELTEDQTILTIKGEGSMEDYTSMTGQPWYYSRSKIQTVILGDGITYIGAYSLCSLKKCTSISIPDSVTSTGIFAMYDNSYLTEITLPEGFEVIGAKTFQSCGKLATLYLPSTLKVVDMKSFLYSSQIKDVYYNGTKEQWDKIQISDSQNGNKWLRNATFHYVDNPDVSEIYTDVASDSIYHDAIQYMVDNEYMCGTGGVFDIDGSITVSEVLDILYKKAGSSGEYTDGSQWALANGIVSEVKDEALTMSTLATILKETAIYNGWDTYELSSSDAKVTRGEAASYLSQYLQSDEGTADRFDKITSEVSEIINRGGDGKLHVIAVNLFTANVDTKPGDCTFIIFPDGETMMIDSGASAYKENVLRFLSGANITNLDYFVISHPHSDHYGNAASVAQYIVNQGGSIGHYYYTGVSSTYTSSVTAIKDYLDGTGTEFNMNFRSGETLEIGGVQVEVFSPYDSELNPRDDEVDTNNASMSMKFTYGTSTYLTCGDLYKSKEKELVSEYGSFLQADVVKLNHHGAYTSNSDTWLNAVRCQIALVEDADDGDYYTCKELSAHGVKYYSAGMDQTVMVTMDDSRDYTVTTGTDSVLRSYYSEEKLSEYTTVTQAESLIDAIGEVSADSQAAILAAEEAYAALTTSQKAMVYTDKLATLTSARDTYEAIIAKEQEQGSDSGDKKDEEIGITDAKSDDTTSGTSSTGASSSASASDNTTTASQTDDTTDTTIKSDDKPAKAKIKSAKAKSISSKKLKLVLKKVNGASGYQIRVYTKKNAKKVLYKKTTTKSKVTLKSKKLKNKKRLYIKARAYTLNSNNKKVYGKWSMVVKVKIKG